jgi:seryl-tRNA synthetase
MASTKKRLKYSKSISNCYKKWEQESEKNIDYYSDFIFLGIKKNKSLTEIHNNIKKDGYQKAYTSFLKEVKKLSLEKAENDAKKVEKVEKESVETENVETENVEIENIEVENVEVENVEVESVEVEDVERNEHPIDTSKSLPDKRNNISKYAKEYEMLSNVFKEANK